MANQITLKEQSVKIGDTVKIFYKFNEGEKQKIQPFQGMLIKIRGHQNNRSITVRKLSKDKIGVERIIPIISPYIDKVEVLKSSRVRRAKLYFTRNLSDRQMRDRLTPKKK